MSSVEESVWMTIWSLLVTECVSTHLFGRRTFSSKQLLLLAIVSVWILICGTSWSTYLFSKLEELLWDTEAFCLQLLFGFLELILGNLQMVCGSEEMLQVHVILRVFVQDLVWLLLLLHCAAHQLVDSQVGLLNLLAQDFFHLLLIVWS